LRSGIEIIKTHCQRIIAFLKEF